MCTDKDLPQCFMQATLAKIVWLQSQSFWSEIDPCWVSILVVANSSSRWSNEWECNSGLHEIRSGTFFHLQKKGFCCNIFVSRSLYTVFLGHLITSCTILQLPRALILSFNILILSDSDLYYRWVAAPQVFHSTRLEISLSLETRAVHSNYAAPEL